MSDDTNKEIVENNKSLTDIIPDDVIIMIYDFLKLEDQNKFRSSSKYLRTLLIKEPQSIDKIEIDLKNVNNIKQHFLPMIKKEYEFYPNVFIKLKRKDKKLRNLTDKTSYETIEYLFRDREYNSQYNSEYNSKDELQNIVAKLTIVVKRHKIIDAKIKDVSPFMRSVKNIKGNEYETFGYVDIINIQSNSYLFYTFDFILSNKLPQYYMLYIYKETIVIWKTINLEQKGTYQYEMFEASYKDEIVKFSFENSPNRTSYLTSTNINITLKNTDIITIIF
jgi:hypothetical protein